MPISGQRIQIPEAWQQTAKTIHRLEKAKVLVLGATDRGKSTFCTYLAWYLLNAGQQPAYIDADVGQKDIGPPTTISLGYPRLDRALQALQPSALYFVGALSPVGHLLPMVVGTRRLLEQAERPYVLINTSGLVEGVGEILKTYQIDSLRPDVIVALEAGRELSPILEMHSHFKIIRLPCPPHAREKSWELRRQNRETAFQRYFSSAVDLELKLHDLIVQRLPIKRGRPDWERMLTPNRLCALADSTQSVLGLGIIHGFDVHKRVLQIRTPAPQASSKILQLGDVVLA